MVAQMTHDEFALSILRKNNHAVLAQMMEAHLAAGIELLKVLKQVKDHQQAILKDCYGQEQETPALMLIAQKAEDISAAAEQMSHAIKTNGQSVRL